MLEDPLSLVLWSSWLMAAGMYPVGFLFGACSDCCNQECVCGFADFASGTAYKNTANWCCAGTQPSEITVRLSNAVSTTQDRAAGQNDCIANRPCLEVTPSCDEMEGDYVLQFSSTFLGNNKQQTSSTNCGYLYVPSCDEYICGDWDVDTETGTFTPPLFIPGMLIAVYASDPGEQLHTSAANGSPSLLMPGSQYKISVTVQTSVNGVTGYNHCQTYYGIPGQLRNTGANGNPLGDLFDNGLAANESTPVLLSFFANSTTVLSEQNCDLRGDISGSLSASIQYRTRPPGDPFGDEQSGSLEQCHSVAVVAAQDNVMTTAIDSNNTTHAACSFSVEIVAP